MERVIEFNISFPKRRPPDNDAFRYEIQSLCFNETDLGISKIDTILFYFLNKWINNFMILPWRHQYFGKKIVGDKIQTKYCSSFHKKRCQKGKKSFFNEVG